VVLAIRIWGLLVQLRRHLLKISEEGIHFLRAHAFPRIFHHYLYAYIPVLHFHDVNFDTDRAFRGALKGIGGKVCDGLPDTPLISVHQSR
jgi:hypothetical protein